MLKEITKTYDIGPGKRYRTGLDLFKAASDHGYDVLNTNINTDYAGTHVQITVMRHPDFRYGVLAPSKASWPIANLSIYQDYQTAKKACLNAVKTAKAMLVREAKEQKQKQPKIITKSREYENCKIAILEAKDLPNKKIALYKINYTQQF